MTLGAQNVRKNAMHARYYVKEIFFLKHKHKENLQNKAKSQLPKCLYYLSWHLPKVPRAVCWKINPTIQKKTFGPQTRN